MKTLDRYMNWREQLKTAVSVGTIIAFLAAAVWWQVYRFRDCRAVGHSMLYCIGSIGN
jgi:hypothetical protein